MSKVDVEFRHIESPRPSGASTAPNLLLPGKHCLLEANSCNLEALNDPDLIEAAMRDAIRTHHATLIDLVVNAFQPQGVTAIALLAESHISVHTWPELNYAAIDAFTCGRVDAPAMCRSLAKHLGAQSITATVTRRGPATSAPNHPPPSGDVEHV